MFERLIKKLTRALDSAKIPYMIFGGQAVLLYGEPRLTRDIDITLGLTPAESPALIKVVKILKLKVLVDEPEDFLKKTFVLPVAEKASGIRIDFVFSLSEFEREAIKRSRKVKLGSSSVRFISPEDLVILKTIAGRAVDLEDIKSVLLRNPNLDLEHIRRWLTSYEQELDENYLKVFNQICKSLKRPAPHR